MKEKIKVLEVIDSLGSGGAESLLKNFVLEAKENNIFNMEIATLYSNAIFKDEIKNAGIPVWDFNLRYKYDLRGIIKLITVIKKGKYDIVHVHLFPANVFAALSSFFLSKDIVWIFSEHNVYNRRRSFKIFKILDSFTYSRYSKIICVSKQVESTLFGWMSSIKGKTKVIPNAVFVSELLNPNHLKIYDILFVGRLSQAKGIDILLKAVKILKNKYSKYLKIAIVGDGPLKENLNNLAVELGVNGEVKFLGVRKDIEELMVSSKIFIIPSRWEGLPMVVLEAMSRGMSIIATTVGGIPEVIKNGKEGILISPEDPETLAQAINNLLENEELQEKLSQAAYEKVREKYSIEAYSTNMLDFYGSLVNN
jgi:glycosyltransferase involved in cell wall biosynthesis